MAKAKLDFVAINVTSKDAVKAQKRHVEAIRAAYEPANKLRDAYTDWLIGQLPAAPAGQEYVVAYRRGWDNPSVALRTKGTAKADSGSGFTL